MPIGGDLYDFVDDEIKGAPGDYGVYALYDGEEIVYIGKAEGGKGIRDALWCNKRGDEGPCTKDVTHFRRELDPSPSVRQSELIEEYGVAEGGLPRCH